MPDPAPETADRIWQKMVISFTIVLVGSFLAIAVVATGTVNYFFGKTGAYHVMLTVFTTAAGFLAGLLSPSPLTEGG
jgi:hypothetical protein